MKKLLKIWGMIALVVTSIIVWWGLIVFIQSGEEIVSGDTSGDCNVAVIPLHGVLNTYISGWFEDENFGQLVSDSASIVRKIETAENDDSKKAIVLDVDSSGGLPVAAEEVANALQRASKPSVALIREQGASAAYYAATGADIIFASKNSDVGGIGVTASYLDNVGQNDKEGLAYHQLSTGRFKDTGDPNKPLTEEEEKLIIKNISITHDNFVQDVARNRRIDIPAVRELADGSTMMGEEALASKLIDRIGGYNEVAIYLQERMGEKAVLCQEPEESEQW